MYEEMEVAKHSWVFKIFGRITRGSHDTRRYAAWDLEVKKSNGECNAVHQVKMI